MKIINAYLTEDFLNSKQLSFSTVGYIDHLNRQWIGFLVFNVKKDIVNFVPNALMNKIPISEFPNNKVNKKLKDVTSLSLTPSYKMTICIVYGNKEILNTYYIWGKIDKIKSQFEKFITRNNLSIELSAIEDKSSRNKMDVRKMQRASLQGKK